YLGNSVEGMLRRGSRWPSSCSNLAGMPGQFVRRSILVAEKLVSPNIADKLLRLGIPLQVCLQLVGDVAKERGGSRAMTGFKIAGARLPAADAIKEIAGVQGGRILAGGLLGRKGCLSISPVEAVRGAVQRRAGRKLVLRQQLRHDFVAISTD